MSSESKRLREQAAKARTLAAGMTDTVTVAALKEFAAECDANAAVIETRETPDQPPAT